MFSVWDVSKVPGDRWPKPSSSRVFLQRFSFVENIGFTEKALHCLSQTLRQQNLLRSFRDCGCCVFFLSRKHVTWSLSPNRMSAAPWDKNLIGFPAAWTVSIEFANCLPYSRCFLGNCMSTFQSGSVGDKVVVRTVPLWASKLWSSDSTMLSLHGWLSWRVPSANLIHLWSKHDGWIGSAHMPLKDCTIMSDENCASQGFDDRAWKHIWDKGKHAWPKSSI